MTARASDSMFYPLTMRVINCFYDYDYDRRSHSSGDHQRIQVSHLNQSINQLTKMCTYLLAVSDCDNTADCKQQVSACVTLQRMRLGKLVSLPHYIGQADDGLSRLTLGYIGYSDVKWCYLK